MPVRKTGISRCSFSAGTQETDKQVRDSAVNVEVDTRLSSNAQHLAPNATSVGEGTITHGCVAQTHRSRPQLQELEYDSESSENDMVIDAVAKEPTKGDWHTTIMVNEHQVTFKIDTGAQCNVLAKETYDRICQRPLRKSRAKLVAFGGHRMNSLGKTVILCEHKNKYIAVEFEVLSKVSNVLGLKTSTEMKLIKRIETVTNDPLNEYADTFSGLMGGTCSHDFPLVSPPLLMCFKQSCQRCLKI